MQPSHFSLESAIRPYILATPAFVTSCLDKSRPRSGILLDANENSLGSCLAHSSAFEISTNGHTSQYDDLGSAFVGKSTLHRYLSASQWQLKRSIADWRGVPGISHSYNLICKTLIYLLDTQNVHVGSGSAAIIDLLIRMTCTPFQDAIMITPPIFGFYRARAVPNNIGVVDCPLELSTGGFRLRIEEASPFTVLCLSPVY